MNNEIIRFIKFSIVGFSGFIVDFGITALLHEVLGVGPYVSNIMGFTIAATTNYILNRTWTFGSDNPNIQAEFIRYIIVSVVGLGINNLILAAYMELVNLDLVITPSLILSSFWIAKTLATGVVMFWNYFINKFFTFRQKSN